MIHSTKERAVERKKFYFIYNSSRSVHKTTAKRIKLLPKFTTNSIEFRDSKNEDTGSVGRSRDRPPQARINHEQVISCVFIHSLFLNR